MDRRAFLRLFGAAAAVAAIDPERLLWEPGKTTHILPPSHGWRPVLCRCGHLPGYHKGFDPDRYLKEAVKALADKIDADAMRLYDAEFLQKARVRFEAAKHAESAFSAEQLSDLEFYKGEQWSARDKKTGISIRMIREWDPSQPVRYDILYGLHINERAAARLYVVDGVS